MDSFDEFHCISFSIGFSYSSEQTSHCLALEKVIIMKVLIDEM